MAFERKTRPVAAKVGRVTITFTQELDEAGQLTPIIGTVDFIPVTAEGKRTGEAHTFNLWVHLTAQQQTGITNLLANLRTRADAEVI